MGRTSRRAVLGTLATAGLAGLATGSAIGRPITADRLPRTGSIDERYELAERVVLDFLEERRVPAAAFGVLESGSVVVERAYGYADRDRQTPTRPDALFRVASLSKPLTRAAVHRLVRHGRIEYDDAVVELLDRELPDGADPRLEQVSVRHLLEHRGGWDRTESGDPTFQARSIADALDLDRAPRRREIVQYVFRQPLDFDPDSRRTYSNFGYALLGTLLEDVTDRDYQEHLRDAILEPSGATDVELARSLPADRPSREVWYAGGGLCRNAVDPTDPWPVRCPDGGFHVEAMDAHGGHVATVRSLLAFGDDYWLSGKPAERETFRSDVMRGHLPGSFGCLLQPTPDRTAVVLCNRRPDDPAPLTADLLPALLSA